MREDKFDLKIKEAFKDQRIDVEQTDWHAMNERLNEEFGFQDDPAAQREFDHSISSKLSADQSEYNHAHWDLLVDRLEKEEAKHFHKTARRFLRYVAAVLLLLSLWNWQGASYFQNNSNLNENIFADLNQDAEVKKDLITDDILKAALAANISTVKNEFIAPSTLEKTLISNEQISNTKQVSNTPPAQNHLLQDQIVDHLASTSRTLNTPHSEEKGAQHINQFVETPHTAVSYPSATTDLALDQLVLADLASDRILNDKLTTLDFRNETKKFALSVGAIAAPDLLVIRTPADEVYGFSSNYAKSKGFSGGLVFSAEKNNIEIQTGLTYSSVSYKPRDESEIYSFWGNYYETSLNNIIFKTLSVPVNFNLYFDLGPQSRVYTTLGATFSTIVNSNFDIADNLILQPSGVSGTRVEKTRIESKDFDEGVFEGGSIIDNTYFSGDIGIGYLRKFKKNWSFYLQPTLHAQYTNGIGPNSDFLNKLSLYTGLKYTL